MEYFKWLIGYLYFRRGEEGNIQILGEERR
jgi:hypothetical protein